MATRPSPPAPALGAVAVDCAEDGGEAREDAVVLGGVAAGCTGAPVEGGTGVLPGKTIGSGAPVPLGRAPDSAGGGTVGAAFAARPGGESGAVASAGWRGSGPGTGGGPDLVPAVAPGSPFGAVGVGAPGGA